MPMRCFIGRFESTDPFENLAREEALFDQLVPGESVFLTYVNRRSVVGGKHQNPWRESNTGFLRRQDIPFLRRVSGGGTVVHDDGNLCFSIMQGKDHFDRKRNLSLVIDALHLVGIEARMTEAFDLAAGGRKFSGNSFCFRRERALHHGTVLVDSDHDLLRSCLAVPDLRFTTHAVRSRPSPVVNLATLRSGLTVDEIADALETQVRSRWTPEGAAEGLPRIDEAAVEGLVARNRSWEWNYGRTPVFSVELGPLSISVRNGTIQDVGPAATDIAACLVGRRFDGSAIADGLARIRRRDPRAGELIRAMAETGCP